MGIMQPKDYDYTGHTGGTTTYDPGPVITGFYGNWNSCGLSNKPKPDPKKKVPFWRNLDTKGKRHTIR